MAQKHLYWKKGPGAMPSMSQALKGVLFKTPDNPDKSQILAYGLAGSLIGGAGALLINRAAKRRLRKKLLQRGISAQQLQKQQNKRRWTDYAVPILSGLASGALGAYIGMAKQNFIQFTGGKKHPSVYRAPLRVNPDKDGKGKQYTIYFSGTGQHGNINDYQSSDNTDPDSQHVIVAGWDQAKQMIEQARSLRPQDKLIVVGHSAGGAEAIRFAQQVGRPVQKLITLDPVELNPITRLKYALFGVKMPQYVKNWQNHLPKKTEEATSSNIWTKYNPGVLGKIKAKLGANKFREIHWDDDHSMMVSGLRIPSNVKGAKQALHRSLHKDPKTINFQNPITRKKQNYLKDFGRFLMQLQTQEGRKIWERQKVKANIRFHLPEGMAVPGSDADINGVDYLTYMKTVPFARDPMLNPFLHMTADTLNLMFPEYKYMRRNYNTWMPLYPHQYKDIQR